MKSNLKSSSSLDSFQNRDIISIRDFTKSELLTILDYVKEFKEIPHPKLLENKLMASCFFEPSTRTRLSFEAAIKRLGGDVIGFADATTTSISKKETLHDTMKIIGQYADVIVLRHPLEGAARYAAEATEKPVINAGDGSNQHPTQTLLDLFTMQESQGHLDELHVAFAGDLKYGRTVHSLVQACTHFNMRMYFIAPEGLELPKQLCDELKSRRILFSFHPSFADIIHKLDIAYLTRIQEERMVNSYEYIHTHKNYALTTTLLSNAKPSFRILHPLPRVNEIDLNIDRTSHAYYFQQSQNGLFVRQALLSLILNQ